MSGATAVPGSGKRLTWAATFVPGLFIPDEVVAERLRQCGKMVDPEAVSCSDFKAAKIFGRHAANYDRPGVAVFACRHGFVPAMVSLQTEENFVYYEVLLEALHQKMDLAIVKAVFLDVACKFEGYYHRCGRRKHL